MSVETATTISPVKKKPLYTDIVEKYRERNAKRIRAKEKKLALQILPIIHIFLSEELKGVGGFKTRGKLDLAALVSLDDSDKEFLQGNPPKEGEEVADKEIFVSSFGVNNAGRLMFRYDKRRLIYEVNGRGLVVYHVDLSHHPVEVTSEVRESYQSFFKAAEMTKPALNQKMLKKLNLAGWPSTP